METKFVTNKTIIYYEHLGQSVIYLGIYQSIYMIFTCFKLIGILFHTFSTFYPGVESRLLLKDSRTVLNARLKDLTIQDKTKSTLYPWVRLT